MKSNSLRAIGFGHTSMSARRNQEMDKMVETVKMEESGKMAGKEGARFPCTYPFKTQLDLKSVGTRPPGPVARGVMGAILAVLETEVRQGQEIPTVFALEWPWRESPGGPATRELRGKMASPARWLRFACDSAIKPLARVTNESRGPCYNLSLNRYRK